MPGRSGLVTSYPKLTTGFLDTQNDPLPGVPLTSPSGSIVQGYYGMVGSILQLSADDAAKFSSPAIVLKGGIYQYVKFTSNATNLANPGPGRLVFWDTTANEDAYQVAQLESMNGSQPIPAGIMIGTPTAGNYGWIQIAGRATVLCRATVTNATRLIQWARAGAGVDNCTFDGAATSAAVLESGAVATTVSGGLVEAIGISEAVAANATQIIVNLSNRAFYPRY